MKLLEIADRLAKEFRARAETADRDPDLVARQVREVAQAGLFRLLLGADSAARRDYLETMSSACGVTTFTASQHQSACHRIQKHDPKLLECWLKGERMAGICFAHVRRPGRPCVTATERAGTITFEGKAPWFTGWGLMDDVVFAGTDPKRDYLFAVTHLNRPEIRAGEPLGLCAMQASNTMPLEFRRLSIASDRLLARVTAGELAQADRAAILANSARSWGVTRRATTLLESRRPEWVEPFRERLRSLRDRASGWTGDPNQALAIRAKSVALGLDAAQACLVAHGGRGNQLTHPAQRLVREAMFYSVTQLTQALGEKIFHQLAPPAQELTPLVA